MNLDEYQKKAAETDLSQATRDVTDSGFLEKVLGLVGETGEMADKIKKIIRDKDGEVDADERTALAKELGDVLWYLASVARYLGLSLDEVARMNLEKLSSRRERGKLHGAGDER